MWSELNSRILSVIARAMVKREEGQALVEYTLILALVSIAAILTLTSLGGAIVARLGDVVTAL
ncbi:MAG: Flp/Fap pilin component [Solirubrobacteraceae bacterium]|jgi:Flp pilus assembly pilin Flp|nr:Flp/Fap pilin component [Solirubrobacteraceae bacterium]